MNREKNLKCKPPNFSYREIAKNYDKEVKSYCSFAHDVIFGMCYEFISHDELLLDIGIGTGLASENFSKAGLKIHGLDNSNHMLQTCGAKGFTESLIEHDISDTPYPYSSHYFNHVICCGVLHFFGDLTKIILEISRIMTSGATFSFTIAPASGTSRIDYLEEPTEWGVPIFKHSHTYIDNQLARHNIVRMKEQRLLIKGADKKEFNMPFSVLVCRYNP